MAEIARAFDQRSSVEEGKWIEGPDGRLDMDVAIRGTLNGTTVFAVIECKDFNASSTGKVGRHYVDALDSKRHDLGADIAIICSNAGFTRDALRKAKRKGIGMISVLKRDDARVRAVIEEELYLCRVRFWPLTITYRGEDETIQHLRPEAHGLSYKGRSLDSWLQHRASLIATANPDVTEPIRAVFRFKAPVEFGTRGGRTATLTAAEVSFSYETEWLAQIVRLDASTSSMRSSA